MAGYVGERARRKKRNTILIFIFIIVSLFLFYIIPKLQMDENLLSETLIPSEQEIASPEFPSDTSEFQRRQTLSYKEIRKAYFNALKSRIKIPNYRV